MDAIIPVLDWAQEVEFEKDSKLKPLPPPSEVCENGLKTVTEYRHNDEGQRVKTVRTFKIEKRLVSKSVALRKTWAKFGDAANDKPGPNAANTIISEKIDMQFISANEEDSKAEEDDGLNSLKSLGNKNIVKCRICSGEHWTSQCSLKDTSTAGKEKTLEEYASLRSSKYVPPSMRAGAANRTENGFSSMEEKLQIKIMNLSESTTDEDLHDLVRPFGLVHRVFLPRDKQRNVCRGHAFVTFKSHRDASMALNALAKYRYDHLVLETEWAKPRGER